MKRTELNEKVFSYILSCIDCSGYNITADSDKDKLQFVADCFKKEYLFPDNLKRYGNYQKVFENWLMGLPSCFNVDYENYIIIQIAKKWGVLPLNADNKAEDKIINNWFNFISCKTFQLMKKHKVLPY